MSLPRAPRPNARATSVLLLGALALHELRYLLGYGSGAQEALARHGHAYMEQLVPALVALSVALVAGALLVPLNGRFAEAGPRLGVLRRAALYAGLMLAVFCAQELAEGWLSAGHPGGLEAMLGHGGWVAIPLALGLGAVAALATRGLERIEVRLSDVYARRHRPRTPIGLGSYSPGAETPPLAALTLAFGLARRPPPTALRI
jgi:hypothetical protein